MILGESITYCWFRHHHVFQYINMNEEDDDYYTME